MVDVGLKLIELARQAFPVSQQCDTENFDSAVKQTAKFVEAGQPVAIFDAAFRCEGVEVRCDIVIPHASDGIDVFEVKSGTKIKARYVKDVALQVHAIENSGMQVHTATVLHLNGHYRHRGGTNYPVHELFKYVDVTDKIRKQLGRVGDQTERFQSILEDPSSLDLPIGTWCRVPFRCGYFAQCRAEATEQPLLELPELTRDQEREFHQAGIEDLSQLPDETEALTPLQQRAMRAIRQDTIVIEPFVQQELRDVEYPLHFVSVSTLLEVLPAFHNARPWHHIPFQWTDTIIAADGERESRSFLADGRTDPRSDFLSTLTEITKARGTLMTYGASVEQRIRDLLEDLPEQKTEARAVLHMAHFDLSQLVHAGVYHPGFAGSFDLLSVYGALVGGVNREGLDITDDHGASLAFRRLVNTRTRATTRKKLVTQLEAFGRWQSEVIADLYNSLLAVQVAES